MFTKEMILPIMVAIFGSGIINCILTHVLHSNKLKKEVKAKNNSMIAENVSESLQNFRDMELMLDVIEIYDVESEFENNGARVDMINVNCAVYPAIFNNKDSLTQFAEKVSECRGKYEKYLSCKLALNLVFIDRYLMKMVLFAKDYNHECLLPTIGAFLMVDLRKWQMRIDKLLVKELNKVNFKLESHKTVKWKLLRKWELEKQWERTLLHYLIEGKCSRRKSKQMMFAKKMFEQAISENTISENVSSKK